VVEVLLSFVAHLALAVLRVHGVEVVVAVALVHVFHYHLGVAVVEAWVLKVVVEDGIVVPLVAGVVVEVQAVEVALVAVVQVVVVLVLVFVVSQSWVCGCEALC